MLAYMILCGRLPFGTEKASVSVADLYSGGSSTVCGHVQLMCSRTVGLARACQRPSCDRLSGVICLCRARECHAQTGIRGTADL